MTLPSESTPLRVVYRLFRSLRPVGGCMVTSYSVGSHGYGQIGWQGGDGRTRMRLAHRVAWETYNGPIPGDLTVDHICRNRKCCRIEHLRLLPNVDNARANGQSLRTHCPRGHAYDEANTYNDRTGGRRCRTCARLRRSA